LGARRGWPAVSVSGGEWSNTRLVQECLKGSEHAWNGLVDRYKNLIYSIPLKYGAPPQDAADIFQSVCLDLFNELPRLRDAEALGGWLIRTTTHKCYHWKQAQRAQGDLDNAEVEKRAAEGPVPPDLLAEIEREQMVRDCLRLLPPRCKWMIELLFFEQPPLAYDEVARRLSLARGSIGFIRGRCLKRLKRLLEEKGF
jgi:RNA polymerase sigma factor (sigma-70 family)